MCLINIKINCYHCHSPNVVKNGKKNTGKQNLLCKDCNRQFQWEYVNSGADPRKKKQVISSLIHGCGIRDCQKVHGVNPKTTLALILKKGAEVVIRPKLKGYSQIQIDEMYSFVYQKGKKVWIFYAYAPQTKEILAITMGRRSKKQLRSLMLQLKHLKIEVDFYCTDLFEGFSSVLPNEKHLAGKEYTKNIEGINTLIRSKIARLHRRTTKFSKKLIYHWFLMKIFIFYFNELPS